jgi:hypothetical protein
MKRKHLLILLGAAIILAVAASIYQNGQSSGWQSGKNDTKVFPDLPINTVAKITVQSAKDTLTLQLKGVQWTVAQRNDYPADFSKIRELLRNLWELKPIQQMQIGSSQFGRLHLVAPNDSKLDKPQSAANDKNENRGTTLDLTDHSGKTLASLIIGKTMLQNNETAPGRFIFNPAKPNQVDLIQDTILINPNQPNEWVDHTFFVTGDLSEIIRKDSPNNPGWNLFKTEPKGNWIIRNSPPNATVDTEVSSSFENFTPSFNDVYLSTTPAAQTGLDHPIVVDLKNFDGFTYELSIGKEGPDKTRYVQVKVSADLKPNRVPAPNEKLDETKKKDASYKTHLEELKKKLASESKLNGWIYQMPGYLLDPLLKARDQVIQVPKPPGPAPTQSPATVHPTPLSAPGSKPENM